ncbi:MAG: hypothetical protein IJK05_08895 [Bacteroidales bacterium]|nr:hypothetical protein [Bacteroidales bacterium]MBQ6254744.1 hypothetical protein [Bacteroidales bacterium]
MKEQNVRQVFLLSDLLVLLVVFLPGIVCLFLGEGWNGAGVIIILCGLMMVPFYHHGYKLEGRKGVFRKKDVLMPRECKEEILAFLDGSSNVLDLHPTMKGGAIVDIYYQKNEACAIARYFDYSEFASGTEYHFREITPEQMKKLESYIP